MARKIKSVVTLQLNAGKATPAPPVGPVLAQQGINTMQFVKQYNERTANLVGFVIPAVITVFDDRSFTFELKSPPAADLLRKAVKVDKGSGAPNKTKIGTLSRAQLREIAEAKIKDLNANDIEAAERMIMGTARSMGIDVATS